LVAILGPSGAGKSTLLRLLAGQVPASQGRVILHNLPAKQRQSPGTALAYLDQDDILHGELQVQHALALTARLRQPERCRNGARQAVETVMARTNIHSCRKLPVSKLSGGERRRGNLCAELLADFAFLFLDEPTASLDPYHSREMLKLVRGIAVDQPGSPGVVVVTHDVSNTDLYDRVIFLVDGYLVYSGPPQSLPAFFGVASLRDVFGHFDRYNDENRRSLLAGRAARRWERWNSKGRQAVAPRHAPGSGSQPSLWAGRHGLSARTRQFGVLLERYLGSLLSDRMLLTLGFAQPLIAALLVIALSERQSLVQPVDFGVAAKQVIFTLTMMAVVMGLVNSHREIVRERRIWQQERKAGLAPGVYLLSRLAFLALLSSGQIVLMFCVVALGIELPQVSLIAGSGVEMIVTLALCAVANTALGLLLSTVVRTSRQAALLLVPVLTIELAMGGLLFELQGWAVPLARLLPSLWAYQAMGIIADVNQLNPFLDKTEFMFLHDATHLWQSWIMLVALALSYGMLAWLSLEFQALWRRPHHLVVSGARPARPGQKARRRTRAARPASPAVRT
jgi:ABC-type multidrug transport system ATPase subunit